VILELFVFEIWFFERQTHICCLFFTRHMYHKLQQLIAQLMHFTPFFSKIWSSQLQPDFQWGKIIEIGAQSTTRRPYGRYEIQETVGWSQFHSFSEFQSSGRQLSRIACVNAGSCQQNPKKSEFENTTKHNKTWQLRCLRWWWVEGMCFRRGGRAETRSAGPGGSVVVNLGVQIGY